MRRLIGTAVAALAVTLAFAGCAKEGTGGDQVASANGNKSASQSTSPSVDAEKMMLTYAKCMREHGIPMADPKPGEGMTLSLKPGQEETMKKAQEACRKYSPEANGAKMDPEMEKKARDYAKCMRDNGVEDFPDPQPDQPGVRVEKKQADDPDFKKAQEKCQSILGGKGKGPVGGTTSNGGKDQ